MPDIDFAALRASRQQSAPQPQPTPRRDWLQVVAIAVIVLGIAWLLLRGTGPRPEPGPRPTPIDVQGLHVLIVRDPSKPGTAGQQAVVNSVEVSQWAKANDAKFRRYDAEDDLSTEDRVWREMRALATSPPQMVTLKNGRAAVSAIPDGIDAAKAQLERLR
jgi:hypothetical protein